MSPLPRIVLLLSPALPCPALPLRSKAHCTRADSAGCGDSGFQLTGSNLRCRQPEHDRAHSASCSARLMLLEHMHRTWSLAYNSRWACRSRFAGVATSTTSMPRLPSPLRQEHEPEPESRARAANGRLAAPRGDCPAWLDVQEQFVDSWLAPETPVALESPRRALWGLWALWVPPEFETLGSS